MIDRNDRKNKIERILNLNVKLLSSDLIRLLFNINFHCHPVFISGVAKLAKTIHSTLPYRQITEGV